MNDSNIPNQDIAAAKTLDGVNIHLGFMSKALERVELNQRAMDVKIDAIREAYITTTTFTEHLKVEKDHEERIRVNEKFQENLSGKMWGIGSLAGIGSGILMILVQYFINKIH